MQYGPPVQRSNLKDFTTDQENVTNLHSADDVIDQLIQKILLLEDEIHNIKESFVSKDKYISGINNLISGEKRKRVGYNATEISYLDNNNYERMLNKFPRKYGRIFERHIIVPVHVPKLTYAANLFSTNDIDNEQDFLCTFVATSVEDREAIEYYFKAANTRICKNYEVISAEEIAKSLEMHDLANIIINNNNNGIINIKKILSLYRSQILGAKEVCCIDSDTIIIRPVDKLFDKCNKNYTGKLFAAVKHNNELVHEIVSKCNSYYESSDEIALKNKYRGNLYSWFFDVPYYYYEDMIQFFNHISCLYGSLERALIILEWHHFDYILYMNYLLLRGDFQLCDVSAFVSEGRLSDDLLLTDLRKIQEQTGLVPAWATMNAVMNGAGEWGEESFFAISHVDRIA